MEKIHIDDSLTATMSLSDRSYDDPPRTHRPSSFFQRRGKARSSSIINIEDLPEDERSKAAKFDVDGNGTLDKIELAMLRYDKDGDGQLGLEEIHQIVEEHLKDKSSIGALRKIVAGLTCFVFILSLSNLGTSLVSAMLVKDTTADPSTAELKSLTNDVMGTQSSTQTFQALEMDPETRRARRAMVVDSLKANPFGEHAHRRLKRGEGCNGKRCDRNISFDTNYISQDDAEKIKGNCDLGRSVNIRRLFPGGSAKQDNLCKTGASIVVKEKTLPKRKKGKGKNKNRISFDMVVTSDGKSTAFDCDGKNCYMSGTNLLSQHGQPCNINHGSDDCASGLTCVQDVNDTTSGKCLSNWDTANWYVDWDNHKCVQDCPAAGGANCGGIAGNWDEMFASFKLCCDTHLSYLSGGYRQCVNDLEFAKEGL